jgi:hypothetical protein
VNFEPGTRNLEPFLPDVEAQMFKITTRHGVKSVLEFDELLKAGKIMEEDILDDFKGKRRNPELPLTQATLIP